MEAKEQEDLKVRFELEALPLIESMYPGALRLTKNPSDAQDLVQETFMKGFANFRQYHPNTNIRAWLYRIMMNTYINQYRARARRPTLSSLDDMPDYQVDRATIRAGAEQRSAELVALDRMPDAQVKAALQSLGPDFRMAVYLADVEGFSYEEIAGVMGTPKNTVASRVFRGRRQLQVALRAMIDQQPGD